MSATPSLLQTALDRAFTGMREAREAFTPQMMPREVGVINNITVNQVVANAVPASIDAKKRETVNVDTNQLRL